MSIKGTTLEFRRLKPPPPFIMLTNISLRAFAQMVGFTKIDFVENPKENGKLFVATDTGAKFKCEQSIDYTKPIVVLMEDGDIDTACFINERANNVKHSISLA